MMSFLLVSVAILLLCLNNVWIFFECSFLIFSVLLIWDYLNWFMLENLFESLFLSVDWLSCVLILLTFLISSMMVSASYSSVKFNNKSKVLFLCLVAFMNLFLLMCFISSKLIYFYVFFEAALIPIFLLVLGWGNQPERLQAGLYMIFYTLFASLPLLIIIFISQEDYEFIFFVKSKLFESWAGYVSMVFFIFAFLVKLPMFMVHLWLPKAHVEAPVAGSMILAGVLLKLGGYGMWRVFIYLSHLILASSWIWLSMGLIGGVIVSFVCFIQVDMKSLVAYSSVVHMGIVLGGLGVLSLMGFEGALVMMLGHGFVSSSMFYLVGVFYDRVHSRSLLLTKGFSSLIPFMSILWFMACIFNISAPPSLSLLSEIILTMTILQWSVFMAIWLMLMNFMSMVYTFYLYAQSQQGKSFFSIIVMSEIFPRELVVGLIHIGLVFFSFSLFWLF